MDFRIPIGTWVAAFVDWVKDNLDDLLDGIAFVFGFLVNGLTAGLLSGLVTARTGKLRGFPMFGTALATVALFALSRITADTALWQVMVLMGVLGFGIGNCMQPLVLAIQNAVPPRDIGVATASATFFRQIGGTAGVAVFLSVLFSTVGDNIKRAFTDAMPAIKQAAAQHPEWLANPYDKAVLTGDRRVMAQVTEDSSIITRMSAPIAHPFKVGFAESMTTVFLTAACIMVAGFLVTLAMPRVELRGGPAASDRRPARTGSTAVRPGEDPVRA